MGGAPFTPLPAPSSKLVDFAPVPLPPSTPSTSAGTTVILVEDNFTAPPLPVPLPPAPPVTSIKDKPSDMGLKDITDKTSWIEAKSVIDSRLRHAPFWPNPTSKALITTPKNMVASAWWEELLNYYLKPPVRDLFVEESQFDGKGFEMIGYIDKHFNPSGTVDLLGYIFDLIDIKQGQDEPVVTLPAHFSSIFASLKMGGMDIASSLQVGVMLRALLSCYSVFVTDFCLGCHLLMSAALQTIIKHCRAFDKDPWTGPAGRNGRPVRISLANTTSAGSGELSAKYDAMEQVSFNYHFSRWCKCFSELSEKCLICHNSSRGNRHSPSKCPILKKLRLKLKKRLAADNSNTWLRALLPKTPLVLQPLPLLHLLLRPTAGQRILWALARPALKQSPTTLERNLTMKESMKACSTQGKVNLARTVLFTCQFNHHAPIPHPRFPTAIPQLKFPPHGDPKGVTTISLPKNVMALLNDPLSHSIKTFSDAHRPRTSLLVADTGATNHMIPDKSAFISCHPCFGRRVRMGNNSFAPILGSGSAIISLNGKKILIRDCLHVPALRNPLYSLRAHQQRQKGC
jgi:hypothetical protein